jgi:hypothetical protein
MPLLCLCESGFPRWKSVSEAITSKFEFSYLSRGVWVVSLSHTSE